MKTIFTNGEAAKIAGITPREMSNEFHRGKIRGYRIPGSQDIRIPREYLKMYMETKGIPLGKLAEPLPEPRPPVTVSAVAVADAKYVLRWILEKHEIEGTFSRLPSNIESLARRAVELFG